MLPGPRFQGCPGIRKLTRGFSMLRALRPAEVSGEPASKDPARVGQEPGHVRGAHCDHPAQAPPAHHVSPILVSLYAMMRHLRRELIGKLDVGRQLARPYPAPSCALWSLTSRAWQSSRWDATKGSTPTARLALLVEVTHAADRCSSSGNSPSHSARSRAGSGKLGHHSTRRWPLRCRSWTSTAPSLSRAWYARLVPSATSRSTSPPPGGHRTE